jgi:hypothetical protein
MLSYSSYDHGYVDFQKRIVQRLTAEKIQHQLLERLATVFDAILADENMIVSRVERERLLTRVTRDVLEDMLKQLDGSSTAET